MEARCPASGGRPLGARPRPWTRLPLLLLGLLGWNDLWRIWRRNLRQAGLRDRGLDRLNNRFRNLGAARLRHLGVARDRQLDIARLLVFGEKAWFLGRRLAGLLHLRLVQLGGRGAGLLLLVGAHAARRLDLGTGELALAQRTGPAVSLSGLLVRLWPAAVLYGIRALP